MKAMEQTTDTSLCVNSDTAMKMITQQIVAAALEAYSGVSPVIISLGISHKNYNGKPYYYTDAVKEKIQTALEAIGKKLILTHCSLDPVSQEDSPLCYGQDIVDQMSVLRQTVKLAYIFETRMGKNKRWRDNRLTRSVPKMTGRVTSEEIAQVNMIIREIAVSLLSVKLN